MNINDLEKFIDDRIIFINNEIENLDEDSDMILEESSELNGQLIELKLLKNLINDSKWNKLILDW